MRRVGQVAFSGLSGASDLCAALAIAGQDAGVPQSVAFWGTEAIIEARQNRCRDAGVATAVFAKKQGLMDRAGTKAVEGWATGLGEVDAFILHYPAALSAVWKAARSMPSRPGIFALEHHPNTLKRPHEWLLSVLLLWLGDGVAYNTETYRSDVAKKLGPFFSLRKHRTRVITNGIELDRYRVPPMKRSGGEFVIGMSGRMMPVKDYATLIRAFKLLCTESPQLNPRLELAGDGPSRGELESLVAGLGLSDRVTFLGLMPFGEMVPRMRSWDTFVLSTHGETQPLALMEAMACGLPCLATRAPGVVDIVEEGKNGRLFEIGADQALCVLLKELAQDEEGRGKLSAGALQYAKAHFSSASMWSNFQNFIASKGV